MTDLTNKKSKIDVLQKYLTTTTKKVKTNAVPIKNQLRVYDRELEGLEARHSEGNF